MQRELCIEDTFRNSFIVITRQLASIELQHAEFFQEEDVLVALQICTKGRFRFEIACEMTEAFFERVTEKMGCTKQSDMNEKILYIKEYMNIFSGHAVSVLNNETGSRSRLSVPCILSGEKAKTIFSKEQGVIYSYQSEYGNVRLLVRSVEEIEKEKMR